MPLIPRVVRTHTDVSCRVVTRPELHQVYMEVARHTGVVFEQPDGELAYGAAGANTATNTNTSTTSTPPTVVQMQQYTAANGIPPPAMMYGSPYMYSQPPVPYAPYAPVTSFVESQPLLGAAHAVQPPPAYVQPSPAYPAMHAYGAAYPQPPAPK